MSDPTVMLERELTAYERLRTELVRDHDGEFALVHGDALVGVFPSETAAIDEGYRRFGKVPLLVRRIAAVDPVYEFVSHDFGG